jgi:hypothetical protein
MYARSGRERGSRRSVRVEIARWSRVPRRPSGSHAQGGACILYTSIMQSRAYLLSVDEERPSSRYRSGAPEAAARACRLLEERRTARPWQLQAAMLGLHRLGGRGARARIRDAQDHRERCRRVTRRQPALARPVAFATLVEEALGQIRSDRVTGERGRGRRRFRSSCRPSRRSRSRS